MPVTRIEDVIVPEIFAQYMIKRTAELSNIIRSGLAAPNPLLNQLVSGGGTTINMPHWQDLSGSSQVLSQDRPIATDGIKAANEVAVLLIRATGRSAHELAGALAGSDPIAAIVQLMAEWWVRDEQRILVDTLNGVFASTDMSDLVLPAGTQPISAELVLDGKQLLGDNAGKLAAICMHSYTFTELQKQNLIEYIPDARGEVLIPTYLGYTVIFDDGMPVDMTNPSTPIFTTYLFQRGVIGRGEGVPVSITPVEFDRDAANSTTNLFHRRALVLHPAGMKWIGTPTDPADPTPSNLDLAKGTNWKRVFEKKQMGMVKILHTLP